MNKEYRRELAQLKKLERIMIRNLARAEKNAEKQRIAINRSLMRGRGATAKHLARLQRRRAILEGRLS